MSAPPVERVTSYLLGTHVMQRPEHHTRAREIVAGWRQIGPARDPEIRHERATGAALES